MAQSAVSFLHLMYHPGKPEPGDRIITNYSGPYIVESVRDHPDGTFSMSMSHAIRGDKGYSMSGLIVDKWHCRDKEPVSDEYCPRSETAFAKATGGDWYARVYIVEKTAQSDLFT